MNRTDALGSQLVHVLDQCIKQPTAQLGKHTLASDEERDVWLRRFVCTEVKPFEPSVLTSIEQFVKKNPETNAVEMGSLRLSYRDLWGSAMYVASQLENAGTSTNEAVGLWSVRHPQTIAGLLGILLAGAAVLPLNPNLPGDRLRYLLRNSDVRTVVDNGETAKWVLDLVGMRVSVPGFVDKESAKMMREQEDLSDDSLAYILYTSGSTGRPKGVMMPHRALANLIAWQKKTSRACEGTRTLQFSPLAFDVSFQEIFSTLCTGGTLVLVPESSVRDPAQMLEIIRDHRIERVFFPFVALQQFAVEAKTASSIHSLRINEVITAGEQLHITPEIVKLFRELPDDAELHNHYGPTETHVVSSLVLQGSSARWPRRPAIGQPIDNASLFLLDRDGEPVPRGVEAELYVAGVCVAKGYVADPELTAQRFVERDVGTLGTLLLYRTGDIVRESESGEIEFLGRRDDQVKVRGFRFEPGELEAILSDHPQIDHAVVVVKTEGSSDDALIFAYLVSSGQLKTPAVLDFLRKRVPEYMIPYQTVFVDILPRTPSGKVNRLALGKLSAEFEESSASPEGNIEETVAGIMQDILKRRQLGRDQSFFDIGGNSLTATRVASRIRDAFELPFTVRDVFDNLTVKRIAETLETRQPSVR